MDIETLTLIILQDKRHNCIEFFETLIPNEKIREQVLDFLKERRILRLNIRTNRYYYDVYKARNYFNLPIYLPLF